MQDIESERTPLESKGGKRRTANAGDEQPGLLGRLMKCFCTTFSTLILLALLNAISVAGIVIGSYYLDKSFCPGQPNLAPTLIVAGALAILLSVFEGRTRVQADSEDDGENPRRNCGFWFLNCLRIAKFCLFIYLCVLVFSLKSHVVTDENAAELTTTADAANVSTAAAAVGSSPGPPTAHYCYPTLFFFAFWTVLLVFLFGAAALFTGCCYCCMTAIFGEWDD